jgi:hypothetical protein
MERQIIRSVLEGNTLPEFRKIKHRMKTFERLAEDVTLYLKLRELITTTSA